MALTAGKGGSRKTERWLSTTGLGALKARNIHQIQNFAKSMKRRKVNSPIKEYAEIQELTPEILDAVIERIEIGHVTRKAKPGNVIQIYWKLR